MIGYRSILMRIKEYSPNDSQRWRSLTLENILHISSGHVLYVVMVVGSGHRNAVGRQI